MARTRKVTVTFLPPTTEEERERNLRNLRDNVAAGLAAQEQRWEKSGHTDLHALLGALNFLEMQVREPEWLFSGLRQLLKQQFPQPERPYHAIRWAMVCEAIYGEDLPLPEAYEWASKKLKETPARGSSYTMEKSYQQVQKPFGRRRRRPSRPRVRTLGK